jgi:hypothetical protein
MEAPAVVDATAVSPAPPQTPQPKLGALAKTKRILVVCWKILVGGFLCQFPVTSVLAIGWSYRYMQRTALKQWWKASAQSDAGAPYSDCLRRVTGDIDQHRLPNWLVREDAIRATRTDLAAHRGIVKKFRVLRHGLVGSFWRNAVIGAQGIINIWTLTFLPVLLWQFGWYSGWNNSFYKGYEQFSNGIAISFIGIGLFLLVMLYVPMALTRQAVTGDWRSFYQFKTVWAIIQHRRLACLLSAAIFSLVSLPITLFKLGPFIKYQSDPTIGDQTATQLLAWLNRYSFWASVFGFIAFLLVRRMLARIYASGLLSAYRAGTLAPENLGEFERNALLHLGLNQQAPTKRHPALELAGKATRPPWRVAITSLTLFVWFTFVAQIYISSFVNYIPIRGFTNQSLIQLPWFRYVPGHLEQDAAEEELETL